MVDRWAITHVYEYVAIESPVRPTQMRLKEECMEWQKQSQKQKTMRSRVGEVNSAAHSQIRQQFQVKLVKRRIEWSNFSLLILVVWIICLSLIWSPSASARCYGLCSVTNDNDGRNEGSLLAIMERNWFELWWWGRGRAKVMAVSSVGAEKGH